MPTGITEFTLMPYFAHSMLNVLVRLSIPLLAAPVCLLKQLYNIRFTSIIFLKDKIFK